MANDFVQKYNGPLTVDLQPIAPILRDVKPGGMGLLRRQKEGFQEAAEELSINVPAVGAQAAISADIYAHFVESLDNLSKVRAARVVVRKLNEILEESEAFYEHECETDISIMSDSVRSAARRKDESLLAPFEKTLAYNGQTAEKAARTRRRNAKAAAEAAAEAEAASSPAPQPAPTP